MADDKDREAQRLALEIQIAASAARARKAHACYGESLDIESWLRHYFPDTFKRPFTSYQRDYWQWVANLRADKAQAPRVECHPRGVGKCLAGSTLVLLADGSQKPIADVQIGERLISYNCRAHKWEADTISNKWQPGRKAVLRITTASGKSLVLTPEHRVLTLGGWLKAGQLTTDHWLAACDGIALRASSCVVGGQGSGTGAGQGGIHPQTPPTFAVGGRAEGEGCQPRTCLPSSSPDQRQSRLKTRGWKRTTVKEFLGLTDEESKEVEAQVRKWKDGSNGPATASANLTAAIEAGNQACGGVSIPDGCGNGDSVHPGVNSRRHQEVAAQGRAAGYVQSTDAPVLAALAATVPRGLPYLISGTPTPFGYTRGIQTTRKDTPHTPKDPYALQWERVVRVEDGGEEECFDVEVERNHCLVTNGLVSHNSTGAETGVVHALAKKVKRYVLYVSATDDQATKHLRAIKTKLENPKLLKDYPHLKPKIETVHKKVANWSAERLRTESGAIVECISLLGNSRGFKSEDSARPDLIVLDDIDSSKESIDVTKKKLDILATEILPTGTMLTDVLMPQNLIHRDSICSMILDKRAQILSNRKFSGPFPLVKNLQYESRELADGASEWVIVAGEPFDPAIGLDYAQHLLQLLGPDAFLREVQQEVWKVGADRDFREWDEVYHIVTWPELVEGFKRQGYEMEQYTDGRMRIPSRWNVGLGWDVGHTREHPSAVSIMTRPDQRYALSDTVFVIGEIVMPEFPFDSTVAPEIVSPGRTVKAIRRRLAAMGVSQGQIELALMSHEASSTRNAVLVDLPEEEQVFFNKWRAAKGSGVGAMQQLLEIDRKKPHPFRVYPKGHPQEGQPLMGKPRLIFVVEDGQGELFVDVNGNLRVKGAKDCYGFARARFEIPIYSWRNTGQKKIDDDFVDCARGLLAVFGTTAGEKTADERFEDTLPEDLRWENIQAQQSRYTKDIYSRMVDQYRDRLSEHRETVQESEKTSWERTWGRFI